MKKQIIVAIVLVAGVGLAAEITPENKVVSVETTVAADVAVAKIVISQMLYKMDTEIIIAKFRYENAAGETIQTGTVIIRPAPAVDGAPMYSVSIRAGGSSTSTIIAASVLDAYGLSAGKKAVSDASEAIAGLIAK